MTFPLEWPQEHHLATHSPCLFYSYSIHLHRHLEHHHSTSFLNSEEAHAKLLENTNPSLFHNQRGIISPWLGATCGWRTRTIHWLIQLLMILISPSEPHPETALGSSEKKIPSSFRIWSSTDDHSDFVWGLIGNQQSPVAGLTQRLESSWSELTVGRVGDGLGY